MATILPGAANLGGREKWGYLVTNHGRTNFELILGVDTLVRCHIDASALVSQHRAMLHLSSDQRREGGRAGGGGCETGRHVALIKQDSDSNDATASSQNELTKFLNKFAGEK